MALQIYIGSPWLGQGVTDHSKEATAAGLLTGRGMSIKLPSKITMSDT